ncbi:MAG: glycosyltransferase family 4 protein [Lachnospiraceae bacterium]|nr:glycosyltransferase family 4 protein [Lachnospiraceae bacterium]
MKILFISHYDNMYGANRALLDLIRGMLKSGAHIPYLVLPSAGGFVETLKKEGVAYTLHTAAAEKDMRDPAARLHCYICPVTQWQAIYKEPVSFAIKRKKRRRQIAEELECLYQYFKDEGIDVIHSNSSVIGTGAMLAERLGCMHVWHIREFAQEHYGMEYFYPEAQVRRYYEQAACLVTISDALKEYMREKYPAANVVRIYDGVEAGKILAAALPSAAKQRADTIRFVYVAYLFPKKQQLMVLQAAAALYAEGERDFHVTFAGTGQPAYEKKLRRFARKHGLSEIAEFAGFVKDIPALLLQSDVGLMASEHEGFGLVTVEYMLAGLPVIGYESGATPEIVAEETGLLYHDKEGLKQAMRKLMKDAALRKRLGENAKKRAAEHFPAEANTAAVLKLYDSLRKGDL